MRSGKIFRTILAPLVYVFVAGQLFFRVVGEHAVECLPLSRIKENSVGNDSVPVGVVVRVCSLPNNFILEIILPEKPVEHDFDVMGGGPVAVVVEAAGLFEDAGHLSATGPHVINVSLGVLVPVFKGTLLLGLAPEDFVVAVRVEGW